MDKQKRKVLRGQLLPLVRQQFGSERERGSGTHGSGQELEACVEIEVFGLKKVSAGSLS